MPLPSNLKNRQKIAFFLIKLNFLANGCILGQNSRKLTPLKIQFYYEDNIAPRNTFFIAWQWHQFDFGVIFTLVCFLTDYLLQNFQIALTHSIFKLKSIVIPLNQMSRSGEKYAQDHNMICSIFMALRAIYFQAILLRDPVQVLLI